MVGGALSRYNQTPYPLGGWPTNLKIILSQRFPTGVRVLSLMSGSPVWRSGIRRRRPQSIWLWRPVGLECRSSTGLGEETPLIKATHEVSHAMGPRAKHWLHKSLGWTWLQALECILGRRGSAVAHCGDNDTGSRCSRKYSLAWALPEVMILAPRPSPTQQPPGSSVQMPQIKEPTGWDTDPPISRQAA